MHLERFLCCGPLQSPYPRLSTQRWSLSASSFFFKPSQLAFHPPHQWVQSSRSTPPALFSAFIFLPSVTPSCAYWFLLGVSGLHPPWHSHPQRLLVSSSLLSPSLAVMTAFATAPPVADNSSTPSPWPSYSGHAPYTMNSLSVLSSEQLIDTSSYEFFNKLSFRSSSANSSSPSASLCVCSQK